MARVREEAILRDALFQELRDGLDPSPEELERHYEQTRNRYLERQIELLGRNFANRDEAAEFETEIGLNGRLGPNVAYAIGPAAVAQLPRELLPEVLRLKDPGDRVVVETDEGWVLVELVTVHPAVVQPLDAVRDRVEASWRTLRAQEAFRRLLAELEAATEVERYEDAAANASIWNAEGKSSALDR